VLRSAQYHLFLSEDHAASQRGTPMCVAPDMATRPATLIATITVATGPGVDAKSHVVR